MNIEYNYRSHRLLALLTMTILLALILAACGTPAATPLPIEPTAPAPVEKPIEPSQPAGETPFVSKPSGQKTLWALTAPNRSPNCPLPRKT